MGTGHVLSWLGKGICSFFFVEGTGPCRRLGGKVVNEYDGIIDVLNSGRCVCRLLSCFSSITFDALCIYLLFYVHGCSTGLMVSFRVTTGRAITPIGLVLACSRLGVHLFMICRTVPDDR